MTGSTSDSSNPGLWVFFYFAANLSLTLHNKWILSTLNFHFPWMLTALHIGFSGIGAYLLLRFYYRIPITEISREAAGKLLMFSVLYSVNIAISNVSLAYVSLAFHQLMRSATPAFTVLMEMSLFRRTYPMRVYLTLFPVVFGICLATVDEFADVSFTIYGLLLTLLGVLLSCLKGIVTNALMVGPLKMHPLEVIWRMALPSIAQCVVYGTLLGEVTQIPDFFNPKDEEGEIGFRYDAMGKLFVNGMLATWLNWVSFTANKKTSALTMTVAGNIKQALSITLAIYVFNSRITIVNTFGIVIALLGGAWYSYEFYREQQLVKQMREYDLIQATVAVRA